MEGTGDTRGPQCGVLDGFRVPIHDKAMAISIRESTTCQPFLLACEYTAIRKGFRPDLSLL